MFDVHQSAIGDYAQQSPDNMARVLTFVVLTIRRQFSNVLADMEGLESGRDDSMVFGFKAQALADIAADAPILYDQSLKAFYDAETAGDAADNLVMLFRGVHGLGFVKAGFAAQLCFGVSACLDGRNIERLGLDANTIKNRRGERLKTSWRRCRAYNALCDSLGGCAVLWDDWCQDIAERAPSFRDAEHVSQYHCDCLGV